MVSDVLMRMRTALCFRLRTRYGAAAIATVALILSRFATSRSASLGSLLVLLALSPAIWWFCWWLAGVLTDAGHRAIDGAPPSARAGRSWRSGSSIRPQLYEDHDASVFCDRGGILFRKRCWFLASGAPPLRVEKARWASIADAQRCDPQYMGSFRDRMYWWYENAFYWTNASYRSTDVKALLYARERQRNRALDHAHALLAASNSPATRRRERIPRDVKRAVWERDGGRCVECDSDFEIQYDHVIPFSFGGSSTVENLQLLCARCNQVKGARL
jgi:HNH endonuclease